MVWLSIFFIPFVCKKWNHTETMPILVVGNVNPLWEQMPSPPKTRRPYATWTWEISQKQDDPELK